MNLNGDGYTPDYLDYNNGDLSQLNNMRVRAKWYDYAPWLLSPAGMIVGTVGVGIYNSWQYNH